MQRFPLHHGDCPDILKTLPGDSIYSIVTDPPYGLSKEPDMAYVLNRWLAMTMPTTPVVSWAKRGTALCREMPLC